MEVMKNMMQVAIGFYIHTFYKTHFRDGDFDCDLKELKESCIWLQLSEYTVNDFSKLIFCRHADLISDIVNIVYMCCFQKMCAARQSIPSSTKIIL